MKSTVLVALLLIALIAVEARVSTRRTHASKRVSSRLNRVGTRSRTHFSPTTSEDETPMDSLEDVFQRFKPEMPEAYIKKAEESAEESKSEEPRTFTATVGESRRCNDWSEAGGSSQSGGGDDSGTFGPPVAGDPGGEPGGGFRETTHPSFVIDIVAKSWIKPVPVTSCPRICTFRQWVNPFSRCPSLSMVWCATLNLMGTIEEEDINKAGGNPRFYTRMKFNIQCGGDGKVASITEMERDQRPGKEGPLTAPDVTWERVVASVSGGVGHVGYMASGRPHLAAEPSFQAIRLRRCTYIWHFPYFKITSCTSSGWEGQFVFGGSYFPTRRLWQDGVEKRTVEQREIADLWTCSDAGAGLVDGDFPYGYDYSQ